MVVSRQMKARKIKQRLGLTLAALVVTGTALFAVLRVEAGIAVWAPPTMTQISNGNSHSCGIADGKAYCWGDNTSGQLGNNSTTQSTTPVAVYTGGVLSGKTILQLDAGEEQVCAIASDHLVYCWGGNSSGQLGNGSYAQSSVPVAVSTSGVLSGKTILSIASGGKTICAIASDNQAYCWGNNYYGQFGDNSTTDSTTPVAVYTAGVLSGKTVLAVSVGESQTCAIASDNQAYCWGNGSNGHLGNNSTSNSSVPVAVYTSGALSGKTVLSISSGNYHTCVIASDNQAYCWGWGEYGQLGNNTLHTYSSVPVAVYTSGVLSGKTIRSVSSGRSYTCAVASDNNVYCWGDNGSGQHGNNSTDGSGVPIAVSTSGALSGKAITSIATDAGAYHTCVIASDNQAYCWGSNSNGQLGNNSTTLSLVAVNVLFTTTFNAANYRLYVNADSATPGSPLAGINTSAALTSYGQAFRVRMGVKTTAQIGAMSTGATQTCGLASGKAYCWGDNTYGGLGNNSHTNSSVPVAVDTSGVLAGKTIRSISSGWDTVCAIASDNQAYCWGTGYNGQLGNSANLDVSTPVAVTTSGVLSGKTIVSISVGARHACAIASDNKAYCWGSNGNGQLGNNSTADSNVPVAVNTAGVLSGKTILSIAAGVYSTCVIASDNLVYCWGYNDSGQLGNNSTTQSTVPVAVTTSGVLSGKTVRSLSISGVLDTIPYSHVCVVASDNQAYCWGSNASGMLGNNSTTTSSVPVAVTTTGALSGKTVRSVVNSGFSTCALASDNQVYCWGFAAMGDIGNNSTTDSWVPVAVTTSGGLAGKNVTTLIASQSHQCAITQENPGAYYCWGTVYTGDFGNGVDTTTYLLPTLATPLTEGYVNGPDIPASANTYKLQFAQKTLSTCSVQTGFADVTSSTAIAFNTNASVSNGAGITSNANDPVATTSSVPQTYISAAGTFTNAQPIPGGKTGLWDFSLKDNSGLNDTSYCLRIVYSDSTTMSDTAYAEVKTVPKIAVNLNAYRFYQNADSLTPGTALGTANTATNLVSPNQAFRLRASIASTPNVTSLTVGGATPCVISSSNAYCWGVSDQGQMGNGSTGSDDVPRAVTTSGVLSGKTIKAVSSSAYTTCVIASDDQAYCWGYNNHGQVGDNSTTQRTTPVAVNTSGVLSGKTILAISAGDPMTCALASDYQVYCWGANDLGQLGNNSTTESHVPVAVYTGGVLSGKTIQSLSAGTDKVCVIASDSNAYCWGDNGVGGLGSNSGAYSSVPAAVTTSGVLSGKTILSISAGAAQTCAVASDNQAYCWGSNYYGQLGDGGVGDGYQPVAVYTSGVLSGKTILAVSSGKVYGQYACALASDHQVYCWGINNAGQLGDATATNSNVPVAVYTGDVMANKTIQSIEAGNGQNCALDTAGGVYCWGSNWEGSLGGGFASANSTTPVRVLTNMYIPGVAITASANPYKLQFAQKTMSTCSAQTTGFADVTASSAIAFNTNASVTTGSAISTTANDPLSTSYEVAQSYISAAGSFVNPNAIPTSQVGLWDFSLKDNSSLYSTSYCLRIVYADGSAMSNSVLPELRTTTGTLSVGFVDGSDALLSNPTISFTGTNVMTSSQTAYGTLGTPSQKLRVYNDLATNGWSASMAATNGPTALWNRSDNLAKYDFNDSSGANDGGDTDTLGGSLSVNPSVGTVASSSCATTGLSLGSSTSFNEGATNSITLFSASSTAAMGCGYDLTNTGLMQLIPASQPSGTYTLDMTITVVAL